LFISVPYDAVASQSIRVTLNGQQLDFDVPPALDNGRVLVPLRKIFEALDVEVRWDSATKTVTATKYDTTIELTIGKKCAYKNGTAVTLDVPAKLIKGRTLVPIRFVSEALGAQVSWENQTHTVEISDQTPYHEVLSYLNKGDLANARSLVISVEPKYQYEKIQYHGQVIPNPIYIFPEGEANRYYLMQGNIVTYIEAKNGIYTVTWQADLDDNPSLGEALKGDDTFSCYAIDNGYKTIKIQQGEKPNIEKPLVFFEWQAPIGSTAYGTIDRAGKQHLFGTVDKEKNGNKIIVGISGEKIDLSN